MKTKFYQEKGFFLTLLTSILIISIILIIDFKKTLFVRETGHLKILGGGLGIILAIGLILKWKYVRQILGVLVLISLVGVIFIAIGSSKEFLLSYSILLSTLFLIAYLLLFSKSVKDYINSKCID
jgi:putative effector of murein hydrolase